MAAKREDTKLLHIRGSTKDMPTSTRTVKIGDCQSCSAKEKKQSIQSKDNVIYNVVNWYRLKINDLHKTVSRLSLQIQIICKLNIFIY